MTHRLNAKWIDIDDILNPKINVDGTPQHRGGGMQIEKEVRYRVVWKNDLNNKIDMGCSFESLESAKDYAEAMSRQRSYPMHQISDRVQQP